MFYEDQNLKQHNLYLGFPAYIAQNDKVGLLGLVNHHVFQTSRAMGVAVGVAVVARLENV